MRSTMYRQRCVLFAFTTAGIFRINTNFCTYLSLISFCLSQKEIFLLFETNFLFEFHFLAVSFFPRVFESLLESKLSLGWTFYCHLPFVFWLDFFHIFISMRQDFGRGWIPRVLRVTGWLTSRYWTSLELEVLLSKHDIAVKKYSINKFNRWLADNLTSHAGRREFGHSGFARVTVRKVKLKTFEIGFQTWRYVFYESYAIIYSNMKLGQFVRECRRGPPLRFFHNHLLSPWYIFKFNKRGLLVDKY